ncbi:MAG: saccharopine dehydrogenase NADP-binding domain-containing protein [Gemmataceae bacterium]|nr:saccharopine dehydrogenase NADP-binding domain-containing protein [Gemmataceae bacterium]
MPDFLLYGANGYTGSLIARMAAAEGLRPILAGRNADALAGLARELQLAHRAFGLDDSATLDRNLEGVSVVLHCAGPFVHTFRPVADACLRNAIHYLDVTGEVAVFEALLARDAQAKATGVMLLPGAGFDVVPTDCLAAHLQRRLPSATKLALAITSLGRVSRGTATTIVENLGRGGLVRKGGVLTSVPVAWKTRTIDFGNGPEKAFTIPWGDITTAYRSTGIPDIEVYLAAPLRSRLAARASRFLGPVLRAGPVQRFLRRRIQAGPPGPSDAERASGHSLVWGEASDDAGRKMVSRQRGPEGYTLTARTALAIVRHVLAGQAPPGFQTPATAYGADLILEVNGVTREDVDCS